MNGKIVCVVISALIVDILTLTGGVFGQSSTCNYYASPNGGGNGLSISSPFKIANFWSVAGPGKTLCLLDGVYTGSDGAIDPPNGLAGTSGNPITIRALNDGWVRIDGGGSRNPIAIRDGNHWFIVRGVNANNSGAGTVVLIDHGASNNRIERVIAWDRGSDNGGVFGIHGAGTNNVLEDCAGFGRGRGIIQATQGADFTTVRRFWGIYNRHITNEPDTVFEAMYHGNNHRFENVIATWDEETSPPNAYSPMFIGGEGTGHQILGSIFYFLSGQRVSANYLVHYEHVGNATGHEIRNSVAYTELSGKKPWDLQSPPNGTHIFANNTGIGAISSNIGGTWQVSNRVDVNTVAQAPNIWNGAGTSGARVCKQYINGNLTNNPLWPWPMDARIREALSSTGRNPDAIFGGTGNSVTQLMEQKFGPIPAECRTGSQSLQLPPPSNLTVAP